MTKSEEIQILRDCAAKLGANSYSGAWLSEQIQFIEAAMRADTEPGAAGLSWNATMAECIAMKSEAAAYAKETRDHAEKEAGKRIAKAADDASRIREGLRADIERIEKTIGAILERL